MIEFDLATGGTDTTTLIIVKQRVVGWSTGSVPDWFNWPRYRVDASYDNFDPKWHFEIRDSTVRELRSVLDGTIKAVRRLTAAMKKASGCALPMPRFGEDRPSAPFERTSYNRARFSKRSLGDNRYRVMLS